LEIPISCKGQTLLWLLALRSRGWGGGVPERKEKERKKEKKMYMVNGTISEYGVSIFRA